MIHVLKLPFTFDPVATRLELESSKPEDWEPHFNTQYYEGDWSGIALRAAAHAHVALYPDPTVEEFVDTESMKDFPSVSKILETFECKTESVRFLRLGSGAAIREHRDYKLSIDDGVARVHIPIKTNPEVDFFLGGERIEMAEGEAWYLNFNLKHSVRNNGENERVHLVIDCIANNWLRSFFADDQTQ